jgi:hypothetical protein
MARAKRNKPHHPAKVHDRRSRDLLRNAEVAAVEVDDPFGLEPGDKIVTLRSIRNDPLVSVREHLESSESFVIQGWRSDLKGRRCGRRRTAVVTTEAGYAIPAI